MTLRDRDSHTIDMPIEVTEPIMDQSYLDFLDQEKEPKFITSVTKKVGKWFGGEQEMTPRFLRMGLKDDPNKVPTVTRRLGQSVYGFFGGQRDLPVDSRGRTAVYGVHEGEAVYGPVDWDQHYQDWNRIGKDYNEFGLTSFASKALSPKQRIFIERKGFRLISILDEGGFAEVWKVSRDVKQTNEFGKEVYIVQELALKIVQLRFVRIYNLSQWKKSVKEAVEQLTRESDLHVSLEHENIVKIDSILNITDSETDFPAPICVCMFMELMDGTLFDLFCKAFPPRLSPEQTREWFVQICDAMRYLHGMNIAHMDIKPNNVLLKALPSGKYIYKLTDFGLAVVSEESKQKESTPGWSAPEVLSGYTYSTFPADIYSLGLALLMSLIGVLEFQKGLTQALKTLDWYRNTGQLEQSITDLIESMVSENPNHRPTIDEVSNHPWTTSASNV